MSRRFYVAVVLVLAALAGACGKEAEINVPSGTLAVGAYAPLSWDDTCNLHGLGGKVPAPPTCIPHVATEVIDLSFASGECRNPALSRRAGLSQETRSRPIARVWASHNRQNADFCGLVYAARLDRYRFAGPNSCVRAKIPTPSAPKVALVLAGGAARGAYGEL